VVAKILAVISSDVRVLRLQQSEGSERINREVTPGGSKTSLHGYSLTLFYCLFDTPLSGYSLAIDYS